MLNLNATLASAQDDISRHGLVEIKSVGQFNPLPLLSGLRVSDESSKKEIEPVTMIHSTGRLLSAYFDCDNTGDDTNWYINYGWSDVSRVLMEYTRFAIDTAHHPHGLSICELANGNIGITYIDHHPSSDSYLRYKVIDVTGDELDPAVSGIIATWGNVYTSGPTVIKLVDDSYVLAYVLYDTGSTHYHLYYQTSSDFTTWGSANEVADGLDATFQKGNPSLNQEIDTDEIYLWFDRVDQIGPNGEEIKNIYYCVDWAAAVKWSNFDSYGESGEHPVAVQKTSNQMYVVFDKIRNSLTMDTGTADWIGTDDARDMHFDPATNILHVVTGNSGGSGGEFRSVVDIDVTAWEVDATWSTASIPAFDTEFDGDDPGWKRFKGNGKYVIVGGPNILNVLDTQSNAITHYYFRDTGGHSQNVTWDKHTGYADTEDSFCAAVVDANAQRVYCLMANGYIYNLHCQVGWIDLTEAGPTYTFNEMVDYHSTDLLNFIHSDGVVVGAMIGQAEIRVFPSDDFLVVNWWNATYVGATLVVTISTSSLYRFWAQAYYSNYPYHGLWSCALLNGVLYGGIYYYSGQPSAKGACLAHIASSIFEYKVPSYAAVNNYNLNDAVVTEDDKILFASNGYGIALYDPGADYWYLYDNTSVPGLTPNAGENFGVIDYDQATQKIYAGVIRDGAWNGIVTFDRGGALRQSHYSIGTYTVSWSWSTADPFVNQTEDFNASVVVDPDDNGLFAFWVSGTYQSVDTVIMWAKEEGYFDLTSLIKRQSGIKRRDTIDGANELEFTVSNGHLFDFHNLKSLWRTFLKKGRRLTLREGCKIGGVDYWQELGTYIITQAQMSGYKRNSYPTMLIKSQDEIWKWKQISITATPLYDGQYAEDIIVDLITRYTTFEAGDISLPTFDNRRLLYYQQLDTDLWTCVEELARSCGYYVYLTVTNTISARRISISNSVDLAFTNNNMVEEWTPDDSYSDLTNRVVVHGEERGFIEILQEEERVATLRVTHRWNTGKKTYVIWYDERRSRRCKYPRMNPLESVRSLAFRLARKGTETLVDDSAYDAVAEYHDKYCKVIVDTPSLVKAFTAAILALLGSFLIPNGWVKDAIRLAALITALEILASTTNVSYEIFARPVGYARRTCQSDEEAPANNDETLQDEIGGIIVKKEFTDPLCYEAYHCNLVAAYEMMVARMQRRRYKLTRVCDLRLEAGDTITMPHPWSGDTMTLFATDVSRIVNPPKPGESQEAYSSWYDEIEGWVIS